MKKNLPSWYIIALCLFLTFSADLIASPQLAKRKYPPKMADKAYRSKRIQTIKARTRARKRIAWQTARENNWPIRTKINGTHYYLHSISNGRPVYLSTFNQESAITVNLHNLRQAPPFYLDGTGIKVGIWDGGHVNYSNPELQGRVSVQETNLAISNHATHVAGTLAASGVKPTAKGMAPNAEILSYDYEDYLPEITDAAMESPDQSEKIQVSNHSYGTIAGWEKTHSSDSFGWHWWGKIEDNESLYFGKYTQVPMELDHLCYETLYHLQIQAVGNQRNFYDQQLGTWKEHVPEVGDQFWYQDYHRIFGFQGWQASTYDPSVHPPSDSWDNGGFDTIPEMATAKNTLVVGATNEVVTSAQRDLSVASSAFISSWGPVDDGRVKPDLVACGINVYSCTAYFYSTYVGTSCAAPAATGAAALLIQHYSDLFPSDAMWASTIKGILIHTADDIGNPGPDYKFGFGLINSQAAVQQLTDHYKHQNSYYITEDYLDSSNPSRQYTFVSNGTEPVKITIVWTDPPFTSEFNLDVDSPIKTLVNDLDIQLLDPAGNTHHAFLLDPANPDLPAATGDNQVDNVEQIIIQNPNPQGIYTLNLTHKSNLYDNSQNYSLFISGQQKPPLGDFNDDKTLDLQDMHILSENWLTDDILTDIAGQDNITNMFDFAAMAQNY